MAFLRQALQRGELEAPYRGPALHTQEEWTYTNGWDGGLDRFAGAEAVERAGVVVYRLRYAGGQVH
jgi:hypothetical protein